MNKFALLCCLMATMLLASGQSTTFFKSGIGLIGFSEIDSVQVSDRANVNDVGPAYYASQSWPEMSGSSVYGMVVWPCLADSADWYKVNMVSYLLDISTGDIVGDTTYVSYVKKSKHVNFQSWKDYLKGKYIYGFHINTPFYHQPVSSGAFACAQQDCLYVKEVNDEWMLVNTIQNSDCTEFGEIVCLMPGSNGMMLMGKLY